MDWLRTNHSPTTQWSERGKYHYYTQSQRAGVAWEYIIKEQAAFWAFLALKIIKLKKCLANFSKPKSSFFLYSKQSIT